MERFEIEFSRNAVKNYKKLPGNYKALVDLALSRLSEGLPVDLNPIAGEENTFRIRVGKYRLLFEVTGRTILIVRIGSRGDVYKH
ncbi:MAG: type II toxin-antitoxin system RelE/ParE family toxin [Nitrospirae bacterium]|nr:type II toxin-antitoxin system RelE/ParE family toxin [Nitrospirota bacterium]